MPPLIEMRGISKSFSGVRANADVNLSGDDHSVFRDGGTALVVHAKADDLKSDPACNAGDRIACGVITK